METNNSADSVMIDLETLGVGPNAAVIQLGAVPFDSRTGATRSDVFHANIDLHSSIMLGGEVDEPTVRWWRERGGLEQRPPIKSLRVVLVDFARWLAKFPEAKRIWAQGPSFDVAILEGYYQRAKLETPWAYNAARDTRTVYDLARERGWEKPAGTEPEHVALEDCRRQIVCLMAALRAVRTVQPTHHGEVLVFGDIRLGEEKIG